MKVIRVVLLITLAGFSTTVFAKNTKFAGCTFTFESPKVFNGNRQDLFPAKGVNWEFKIADNGASYKVRTVDGDKRFNHGGVVHFTKNSTPEDTVMISNAIGRRTYDTMIMSQKSDTKGNMVCYHGVYHIYGQDPRKGFVGSAMGYETLCCPK